MPILPDIERAHAVVVKFDRTWRGQYAAKATVVESMAALMAELRSLGWAPSAATRRGTCQIATFTHVATHAPIEIAIDAAESSATAWATAYFEPKAIRREIERQEEKERDEEEFRIRVAEETRVSNLALEESARQLREASVIERQRERQETAEREIKSNELGHDFTEAGLCVNCKEGKASLKPCPGKREEPSGSKDRFELIEID